MATSYVLHGDSGDIIGSIALIATIPNVNLKNTGLTTLFTVPVGKQFIMDDVRLQPTVNGLTVEPIFNIGANSSHDDWSNGAYSLFLSATNNDFSLRNYIIGQGNSKIGQVYQAGDVIKFEINTGATATSFTGILRIFGILI